eukprot:3723381-Prymnesium_polylepis.1
MVRICFARAKELGEEMDLSATPLYREPHLCAIDRAYALDGSAEAAMRAFSVETLWRAGGRGGETAYMHLDGLEWDPFYDCPYAEIAQTKTSKVKKVAFVAGVDRRHCWFLKLGDYLALRGHKFMHTPGEALWLFPELHDVASASKKLGDYITAVMPKDRGGLA